MVFLKLLNNGKYTSVFNPGISNLHFIWFILSMYTLVITFVEVADRRAFITEAVYKYMVWSQSFAVTDESDT